MPSKKLYATAVKEDEVDATYEERSYSRQPQRKKIFIIGGSHLTRIKKDISEKKIQRRSGVFEMF